MVAEQQTGESLPYPTDLCLPERRLRDLKVEHNHRILNQRHLLKLWESLRRPTFFKSLLEDFEEDSTQAIEDLRSAIARRNSNDYRRVLHALIGSARDVGASAVEYTCQRLKDIPLEASDDRIIGDIEKTVLRFRSAFTHYLASLSKMP
jgi:HPt (histidine-containing phosphotransfer) domain-containing protein